VLLKDKRIFMIEDSYVYAALASVYLRIEGAVIVVQSLAMNVPQVLKTHLPIDVILMDLVFATSASGFDVFDEIRQVSELAEIPVVAVSAMDPAIAVTLARQKGFAGLISKPFSSMIAGHVARVLAGEQVWAAESWRPWVQE